MKRAMKKVGKATIYLARIIQYIARLTMMLLGIGGSLFGGFYTISNEFIIDNSHLVSFIIVELLILMVLITYSFFNEIIGSVIWVIYSIITFFYYLYRVPNEFYSVFVNWFILIIGFGIGMMLFFTWFIEWNDPVYRILRKVEEKSFHDT
jgi:hypothetical protein